MALFLEVKQRNFLTETKKFLNEFLSSKTMVEVSEIFNKEVIKYFQTNTSNKKKYPTSKEVKSSKMILESNFLQYLQLIEEQIGSLIFQKLMADPSLPRPKEVNKRKDIVVVKENKREAKENYLSLSEEKPHDNKESESLKSEKNPNYWKYLLRHEIISCQRTFLCV
jgi:hypothetical protein